MKIGNNIKFNLKGSRMSDLHYIVNDEWDRIRNSGKYTFQFMDNSHTWERDFNVALIDNMYLFNPSEGEY